MKNSFKLNTLYEQFICFIENIIDQIINNNIDNVAINYNIETFSFYRYY